MGDAGRYRLWLSRVAVGAGGGVACACLATEPLRLAAVTCTLGLGGSTTFLLNFLRALGSGPEELRVICTGGENELVADFLELGVKFPPAPGPQMIYEDRLAWTYRHLAAAKPHAVLACLGAESFEMLRLAPAGVARIGVIQSHDPMPYEMARRYHRWLDAMVGVSPQIASHLRGMAEFAGMRIEEIPYGIHFGPSAERLSPRNPLRVLYLGRLIEVQKRISRMVSLIQACAAAEAPVQFTLAGSGPEEAQVRAALAQSPNVAFTGAVPNAEISALLREHDIFILLSDFEGLPLSLLEAMGEGLVPIVSDLPGGMGEVVSPEVGFRLPVGDVRAAADLLLALAQAPERLAPLSRAARSLAREHYSAERMVQQYLALVRSLVPPSPEPDWPASQKIPAPLGLPAWQYRGLARHLRRGIRRLFPKS